MILIIAAVVVVGAVIALFGWDRYRGGKNSGSTAARPTDEVFIDPETGRRMRVWYDEHSGRREYRPDGSPGQGPSGT
jgi:hypothetical protein